jgi:hypothetical protein
MESDKVLVQKANKTIEQAVADSYTTNDTETETLDLSKFDWSNLVQLKKEMADQIMTFVGQVHSLIYAKEVIEYLPKDSLEKLGKVATVFFKDIEAFSSKVSSLANDHVNFSGIVKDIKEYDMYNRIVITYHALFTELGSLITPAIADMMLLVKEAQDNKEAQDASVVTDVVPKEQPEQQPADQQ